MKYIILLLLLSFFSCKTQQKDCSQFKTGTFKYADSKQQEITLTRNDSIQIEKNNATGDEYIGSIKWLSNCMFTLTYTHVNNPDYKSVIGTTFNIDINSTTKKSYKYTAYDDTREITGEIIKIK